MFDFVTSIWPGAQRPPVTMPPNVVPASAAGFPQPLPLSGTDDCRTFAGKRAMLAPAPRQSSGHGALILALMAAGRPITVTELAQRMGCSVGESSKRVKAAGKRVRCRREGRCKLVELRPVKR